MTETRFLTPDNETLADVHALMAQAVTAALGVLSPEGGPAVTKIGFAQSTDGAPLTLISDLSPHTHALRQDSRASLLIEAPTERGDPLNSPRLTILGHAEFLSPEDPARSTERAAYLQRNPKAKLYIDFGDFHLVRFNVQAGHLNGGFGKAYILTGEDFSPVSR